MNDDGQLERRTYQNNHCGSCYCRWCLSASDLAAIEQLCKDKKLEPLLIETIKAAVPNMAMNMAWKQGLAFLNRYGTVNSKTNTYCFYDEDCGCNHCELPTSFDRIRDHAGYTENCQRVERELLEADGGKTDRYIVLGRVCREVDARLQTQSAA